jgi:hypothetical protein
MTVTTTTAHELEPLLIDRIRQIVPSHQVEGDAGWAPSAGNRLEGRAGRRARAFEIRIAPGRTVEGGLTGGEGVTEKSLDVSVITDYRAFDDRDLGTIVEHDQWDLYETLCSHLDTGLSGGAVGIPGLTHVEDPLGPEPQEDEDLRIAHQFTVFYLKQR